MRAAAARFGRPPEDWLDLSTGINPNGWPVPTPPPEVWQRLPEEGDGLIPAAGRYYGLNRALPIPGVQSAIQLLPHLRPPCRVGVPAVGYAEHAYRWQLAGHQVIKLPEPDLGQALGELDVLIVINPNNPTGRRWSGPLLLDWHQQLARRGGWLVIDESFIDPTPDESLVAAADRPGLIVLRSLGKFFGLAGIRVGFLFAEEDLIARVRERLGPWAVSNPGRWVARLALLDRAWHTKARAGLKAASARLAELLNRYRLAPAGGTALFQWVLTPNAERIQHQLAGQGILVRQFADPPSLRLGLPGCPAAWERLEQALKTLSP